MCVLTIPYCAGNINRSYNFSYLQQTKLRQAISVLKPHLSSESQISAVAAIQELEALAVMDIGTPLQEVTQVAQPPLPPPAPQQQQQQSR